MTSIERRLNEQQVWRDRNWLEERVQEGTLEAIWLERIDPICTILQEVFPDKWDIYVEKKIEHITIQKINYIGIAYIDLEERCQYFLNPIIKFDTIEITNTARHKHIIRNLFIMLKITTEGNNKLHFSTLYGTRSLLSYKEYMVGYYHSHLRSRSNLFDTATEFDEFCLGQGEIRDLFVDLTENFNEELFALMLYQIKIFAKWESTEGRPFIKMNDIYETGRENAPNIKLSIQKEYFDRLVAKRKVEGANVVSFKYIDDQFKIIENNAYEIFLLDTEILEDPQFDRKVASEGHHITHLLCTRNNKGMYFKVDIDDIDGIITPLLINTTNNNSFIFRGQEITFTVEQPIKQDNESQLNFYINPQIKKYATSEFEKRVNSNIFKHSAIDACY